MVKREYGRSIDEEELYKRYGRPSNEEERKDMKRKERNRLAAKKSRDRRSMEYRKMHEELQQLSDERAAIYRLLMDLYDNLEVCYTGLRFLLDEKQSKRSTIGFIDKNLNKIPILSEDLVLNYCRNNVVINRYINLKNIKKRLLKDTMYFLHSRDESGEYFYE